MHGRGRKPTCSLTPAFLTPSTRTKLHSTNPLERPNKEVKRRADVERNFPERRQHHPPRRGFVLMEQNDEWQLQHRYTCRSKAWPNSTNP
ncbi:transposase [Novosphingobium sp.]|uniref:transposase n=1 Tax=Novosphingobium sp. TaxID=1874826 RepID=UPI0034275279